VGLALLLAEYVTFFKEHGARREIWASRDEPLKSIGHSSGVWRARLPNCCAICGEPTPEPWIDEERVVPDLTWPLWLPVLGLAVGLIAAIYLGSVWLIPLGAAVGCGAGYRLGGEQRVELRFRRCADDARNRTLPRTRLAQGRLVIDVGHRSVYRKFRDMEDRVAAGGSELDDDETRSPSEPARAAPTVQLFGENPRPSPEGASAWPPKSIPLAGDDDDQPHNRHD
jgi:hypothetical protein